MTSRQRSPRVLLMVQNGSERPRVQAADQTTLRYMSDCPLDTIEQVLKPLGRRWWLVEAESAAAGRNCISYPMHSFDPKTGALECEFGRILASGGKP